MLRKCIQYILKTMSVFKQCFDRSLLKTLVFLLQWLPGKLQGKAAASLQGPIRISASLVGYTKEHDACHRERREQPTLPGTCSLSFRVGLLCVHLFQSQFKQTPVSGSLPSSWMGSPVWDSSEGAEPVLRAEQLLIVSQPLPSPPGCHEWPVCLPSQLCPVCNQVFAGGAVLPLGRQL